MRRQKICLLGDHVKMFWTLYCSEDRMTHSTYDRRKRGATSNFIDFEITNSITDTITPFHLFAHGPTIMLGKESEFGDILEEVGR